MSVALSRIPPVLWALALFLACLGFRARFDLPLAVLAGVAAWSFGQHPQRPLPQLVRDHWPVALFLAVAALVTATSVDPRHSLGVQPQLLPALLSYAVITAFALQPAAVRFVASSLLAAGLLTALLMLATVGQARLEDPSSYVKTLGNALLIVPNDVLMLAVIVPLALGLAWAGGQANRLLVVLYLLLALVAGVLLQSRQTVLAWGVGVLVLVTLMRPRWVIPVLVVGTVLGLVADYLLGWPLARKIFLFPRLYVWHTAWVMFLDSPWLGQGPGMFKDLYYPFLEKAGYVLAELGDRRTMPWAHCLYLEQLAERGVVGLLALLALLGRAFLDAGQAYRQASSEGARALAAGVLAALGGLAFSGIAEATLSRLWVTVLLFTLAGLARALARQGREIVVQPAQSLCGGVEKN